MQARFEFKTRQIMKLLNQKAKVTSFFIFFYRNQPMTQPSAGKNQNVRGLQDLKKGRSLYCPQHYRQHNRNLDLPRLGDSCWPRPSSCCSVGYKNMVHHLPRPLCIWFSYELTFQVNERVGTPVIQPMAESPLSSFCMSWETEYLFNVTRGKNSIHQFFSRPKSEIDKIHTLLVWYLLQFPIFEESF